MLNKQEVIFKEPEYQEIKFGNLLIKVKSFLSLTDQLSLTTVYLEEYFSKEEDRILKSEYKVFLGVIDFCTDINIEKLFIDDIFKNYKLWEEIKSKIKNYGDFRALLARTVDEIKETKRLEKSLGNVLESLFEKMQSVLNTEISPESIEKIQELLKDIDKSKILKSATEIYNKDI